MPTDCPMPILKKNVTLFNEKRKEKKTATILNYPLNSHPIIYKYIIDFHCFYQFEIYHIRNWN